MSEQKEETQKTVVSFVVGLLIGGLLVWAFSGTEGVAPTASDDEVIATTTKVDSSDNDAVSTADEGDITPSTVVALPLGEGSVEVDVQAAGKNVSLTSATFPIKEGWVGVRDYNNDQLGGLLGVVRFSEEQGLVPNTIILQRETKAGESYAVVFYTDNGDREFSLATDVQVDKIFATFTAK